VEFHGAKTYQVFPWRVYGIPCEIRRGIFVENLFYGNSTWAERYENSVETPLIPYGISMEHDFSMFTGRKGKERKGRVFIWRYFCLVSKRSEVDHTLCKLHHACLSFVSVHQMAPPLTEVADIQLQLTVLLSDVDSFSYLTRMGLMGYVCPVVTVLTLCLPRTGSRGCHAPWYFC